MQGLRLISLLVFFFFSSRSTSFFFRLSRFDPGIEPSHNRAGQRKPTPSFQKLRYRGNRQVSSKLRNETPNRGFQKHRFLRPLSRKPETDDLAPPHGLGAGRANHRVPAELLREFRDDTPRAFLRSPAASPVPRGGPDMQHLPRHPERRDCVGESMREERERPARAKNVLRSVPKVRGFFSIDLLYRKRVRSGEELHRREARERGCARKERTEASSPNLPSPLRVDFFSLNFFLSPTQKKTSKTSNRPRPAAPTTPTASASGSSWAARPAR